MIWYTNILLCLNIYVPIYVLITAMLPALVFMFFCHTNIPRRLPNTLSAIKKRVIVTTINIGIYLKPSLALPFFIVDIITEEKNEVIIKDTTANILKSEYFMPESEK